MGRLVAAAALSLCLTAIGVLLSSPSSTSAAVFYPLEEKFRQEGRFGDIATVTVSNGSAPYVLVYSRQVERHPIVIWGNGNGSTPSSYPGLLRHFASWGYVVAAPTGNGADMLSSRLDVIAKSKIPGDPLYRKVDTDSVAAVGHSRGGVGALNLTNNSAGLVKR